MPSSSRGELARESENDRFAGRNRKCSQITSSNATPNTSTSKGYDSARLSLKPDETSWSANDILAHLRSCADVWGNSILKMIAKEHPTLRYVSPRTWIRKTDYLKLEFRISLKAFIKQRYELLKSLKALAIEDWSRGATFTGTTQGRQQTVWSYAQRLAQHENEHLEQIKRLLKSGEPIRSAEQ